MFTKLEAAPKPRDLTVQSLPSSRMLVSWDLRFNNICNANISYRLTWQEIDGKSELNTVSTPDKSWKFESKTSHTKFDVCITADFYEDSQLIGQSKPLCTVSDYSSPGRAGEPTIVDYTVSETEIIIQYGPPANPNGNIAYMQYCLIESKECDRLHDSVWEKFQDKAGNLTVRNLSSCVDYCVLVRANNVDFDGSARWGYSKRLPFTTKTEILPPPTNLSTTFINDTKLSLAWNDVISNCERNFTIHLRGITNCHFTDFNTKTSQTTLLIDNLSPYTTYDASISTVTHAGNGSATGIRETTDYSKPLDTQVKYTCGIHSCQFEIKVPAQLTGPTTYFIYNNGEKIFNSKTMRNISSDMCATENNVPATVTGLTPFEKYKFEFEAIVESITEKTRIQLEITTKPSEPSEPEQLQVDCTTGTAEGIVRWTKPDKLNGKLEEFIVTYEGERTGKNNHIGRTIVQADDGIQYSVVLLLQPDYDYKFKVRAKNQDVDNPGPEAETNCYKTASLSPGIQNEKFQTSHVTADEPNSAMVTLSDQLFSDSNGIIVNYSIIISQENLPSSLIVSRFWRDVEKADKIEPYRTSPNGWNPFKSDDDDDSDMCCEKNHTFVQCRIGCNSNCSNIVGPCNGPLRTDTRYQIYVRAYTSAGFGQTRALSFSTVALDPSNESDESNGLGIVLGIAAFVLIIILCAALLWTFRRNEIYKLIYGLKKDKTISSVITTTCSEQIVIQNQSSTRPVPVDAFCRHYNLMNKDSGLKFSQEFEEIRAISPTFPTGAAHLSDNKQKNRWINILPFDHSRVKLLPISDDISTDYINACYIPGFRSQREYIATQGPLPGTKDDFWRMIWEQTCQMIVMVTQCVERGKKKCEVYWPEDREVHYYGDLAVQLRSESILNNFTIRIFDLFLGTNTLEVKQMHFTKWPDFGCPENTSLLINFVRDVREHTTRGFVGPYVIHCSAGVGRTGTYISVDRLMQHIERHNYVDIYGLVLEMRQFRTNMVQTEDQYIYIHSCVRDLLTGKTAAENEPLYANIAVNSKGLPICDSQL